VKRAIVAGVTGLALALPAQAAAQAPAQANLGVGYGSLREAGADGATYATGWLVAFASRPIGAIRWVGEVGGSYRAPADVRQQLMSYEGGVRIEPRRGSMAPFVQTLAGVEHFSETGFTETGFSIQPGGGLDAWLTDRLAIRGQADYRWVRVGAGAGLPANTVNEWRIGIGVAIGLGR
jgi:hypothetical protein